MSVQQALQLVGSKVKNDDRIVSSEGIAISVSGNACCMVAKPTAVVLSADTVANKSDLPIGRGQQQWNLRHQNEAKMKKTQQFVNEWHHRRKPPP